MECIFHKKENPEKQITALSGVYSTVYLTPKPEPFVELNKASVTLPLLLLLGDKHNDTTGLCTNCTCEHGGCCEIYNPIFLQQLDALASKEYPIDFYTELFFSPLEVSGVAQEFSKKEFRGCYDHTNHRYECPTKHIRWQYTDVRQSSHTLESEFVVIRNVMDGEMEQISDMNVDVLELLLKLYDETTKQFDTRAFSDGFFAMARNKNKHSLIRKQMLKQNYINFRDISYMSMVLEKGIEYIIRENKLFFFFYKGKFNTILRLLIDIKHGNIPELEPYINSFQLCATIMTAINCVWMDLYFILRSFKTPDGFNHQASLCLGFFGNDHVNLICYLLTYVMDLYEIRMESLSSPFQERCTPITEHIDLVNELFYHNKSRQEPVLERDLETQRYHGILSHFYKRSPRRTSSLTRNKKSQRKHRRSSDDFMDL